jgi:A/G-specific adenine glycosylase
VLQLWSGLGYYARARNLHRAAQRIRDEHGGTFPCEFEAIAALPGIGRSTAGAIAALAFGQRRPILDGNVKRVFARYCGIEGYPGAPAVSRELWARAEDLLPSSDVQAYTQGLMDLGATVCVRGRPRCGACPLESDCLALRSGRASSLPTPRPKRAVPRRATRMLLLRQGCDVLLERRPSAGIWGGLWCFPELPPQAEAGHWARLQFGARVVHWQALPTVAHAFTHFQLDIEPLLGEVVALETAAQSPGRLWLPLQDALGAAVPAPVRALLRALPEVSVERPDRGEQ